MKHKKPALSFTVREASAKSGISEQGIRNAISCGRLKAEKVGKRTMIREDEFNTYLANSQQRTPSHLQRAIAKKVAASANRPDRHIEFAIDFLNALMLDSGELGAAGRFLAVHPELREHFAPIIQAAHGDVVKHALKYPQLPKEEKERFNQMVEKSAANVRFLVTAALEQKVAAVDEAMAALGKQ
jgi:excisionase family DNA binding protein